MPEEEIAPRPKISWLLGMVADRLDFVGQTEEEGRGACSKAKGRHSMWPIRVDKWNAYRPGIEPGENMVFVLHRGSAAFSTLGLWDEQAHKNHGTQRSYHSGSAMSCTKHAQTVFRAAASHGRRAGGSKYRTTRTVHAWPWRRTSYLEN